MKITLSLAQIAVTRADTGKNLEKGAAIIAEASRRGSQIVCFPEMWTTGFDWEYNEKAADRAEETVTFLADLAFRHGIWVGGSLPARNDRGGVTNAFYLFDAQGRRAGLYRKVHLFTFMGENRHMAPGDDLSVVTTPWGKIGLAVCYDLRFPEMFRTYALAGAGLIILPAAFPHPRLSHWKVLIRARAIENQLFMACVNQVGEELFNDLKKVVYFGTSCIVDPWGETIAEAGEGEELLTATVDLDRVDEVRAHMRVLKDRRPDLYRL